MNKLLLSLAVWLTVATFLMGGLPAAGQEPSVQSSDFFVSTSDNISIHVHRKMSANLSKIPVLLIHGTWCDGRVWDFPGRSVMDYLAVRGYDMYALDMRGMGESAFARSYFQIDLIGRVQDAIAVANYIVNSTGRAPVVMGWSQGGVITGMLATVAPKLVAGIGLLSVPAGPFIVPPAFGSLPQELQQLAQNGVDRFPLTPDQFYALAFGTDPITSKPTMSPVAFATLVSLEFATPTQSQADSIAAIGELVSPAFFSSPAGPAWTGIQVPALVVDGALDPLVGADQAQALFDALGSVVPQPANKQLIVFPRNSHGWFLEDNFDATMRVFDRFLSQFQNGAASTRLMPGPQIGTFPSARAIPS
jgi:pimeloyl-ACP methyl ester carboxylesterase